MGIFARNLGPGWPISLYLDNLESAELDDHFEYPHA